MLSITVPANAMDGDALQISRQSDLQMSCSEISHEVSAMEDLIHAARIDQEKSAMTSTGVTAAKTVASYLVGSLGGAIGIMAAGYIVGEATEERGEDAFKLEEIAQQRRSFMTGIYNARSCIGPLELASVEPAAGDSDENRFKPKERAPGETRYHYND